jgi:hypothetical protein
MSVGFTERHVMCPRMSKRENVLPCLGNLPIYQLIVGKEQNVEPEAVYEHFFFIIGPKESNKSV